VSGNPSTVKISRQTVIDVDQVDKELEKRTKLKKQSEAQRRGADRGRVRGSQDKEMVHDDDNGDSLPSWKDGMEHAGQAESSFRLSTASQVPQ